MESIADKIGRQNKILGINTNILTDADKDMLKEADVEHEARMKKLTIRLALSEMKVPKEYRNATFENYDNFKKADRVRKIVDVGLSLVLSGTPGLGKTHLAVASMQHMANRYDNGIPLFLSAPDLFVELRDRIRDNVTERSIIDRFLRAPLLVIDDLGVETTTDRSVETFYSIIDGRQRNGRAVIITSELTMEKIACIYGDRLASRLCGMGEYIRMQGDDYRMKIQKERGI